MRTKSLTVSLVWIPTVILFFLLAAFYIFQIGNLAQQEYLLTECEKKLSSLAEKKDLLDINLSKMDSLSQVDKYLASGEFVKSNQIKYIQILAGSVASK